MTTRTTRNRYSKDRGCRNTSIDDDDAMMEDDDAATAQGVKADARGFAVRRPCDIDAEGSVTGNSLILPRPLPDDSGEIMSMEDDDVSTLTECSMEEEDDNVSQTTQNTAWTVITTGTDSTTVPTRNFFPNGDKRKEMGEKRSMKKENRLLSNSQFKRRRLA
jgi:hypothetical protein